MDEYAAVMNRYVKIEVRNRFKEGGVDLSLNFGSGDGWLLWLEDGQYCFDEKERGKVRTGGLFNSHSIELTQIVMLNCTVPYLRHALGFQACLYLVQSMSCRWAGQSIRLHLLVIRV